MLSMLLMLIDALSADYCYAADYCAISYYCYAAAFGDAVMLARYFTAP